MGLLTAMLLVPRGLTRILSASAPPLPLVSKIQEMAAGATHLGLYAFTMVMAGKCTMCVL